MQQRLEKCSSNRIQDNVTGNPFITATGGTLLLVEIIKFIHLQDQELFVFLVPVMQQDQIQLII
jgi:hypothetical protein